MNKFFLWIILGILFVVSIGYFSKVIFFPVDILNLFPLFHNEYSTIPHNTLISDPFTQFEPWRYYAKQQIHEGNFPLWNNLNGKGVPFFANGQSAVLFPLNLLYYLFPISISLNLIPLLKLFFLFFFSYLYLKSIKCSERISKLGAFAITFSGFPLVWLLWPHINVYLFFPLLLYITEKLTINSNVYRWYALLAVSYALALLGGHPETLVHVLLLHSVYIFFRVGFQLKKLLEIGVFIALGFCLAAIQLFPLIEYLQHSYVLAHRIPNQALYLPLISFILNIFPFILGAPHIGFSKNITVTTNFQESMGGYTGLIVLIIACLGVIFLFRKNTLVRFWTIMTLVAWLFAYNVKPFAELLDVPILRQGANGRLSAFAAFGLCILFAFFMQNGNKIFVKQSKVFKLLSVGFISLTIIAFIIFSLISYLHLPLLQHPFISLLKVHILFILATTTIFSVLFYFLQKKNKERELIIISFLFIAIQTVGLLGNYVGLISVKQYYPNSSLLNKLNNLPKGAILEIGNPSVPSDVNMIYRVPLAENYDAIDINNYKESFDTDFPVRNHWGKIDSVENISTLRKYGIAYLLIDYNPNSLSQTVQHEQDVILGPLEADKKFSVSFIAKDKTISEIRVLPANYNRKNTCTVNLLLSDAQTGERIVYKNIHCNVLLDKMYYSYELGDRSVIPGRKYVITLSSPDGALRNSVSFWGNKKKEPYVKVFYNSKNQQYTFIGTENGVQLWKVPRVSDIVLPGNYTIIHQNPSELFFEYETKKDAKAEIKIPFYPGWHASIDEKPTEIRESRPFMRVELPAGKHVVKLTYLPFSFLFGMVVSFVSTIILLIYFLRNEKKQRWVRGIAKKWEQFAQKNGKIGFLQHALVVTMGVVIAIPTYIVLLHFIKPHFSMPWTTAINWYTVHHYPRQQDYFYFITAFVFIVVLTLIVWIFWLWGKNKK